jgi:hypothetical protein
MEAGYSSKTLAYNHMTTWCNNFADHNLTHAAVKIIDTTVEQMPVLSQCP